MQWSNASYDNYCAWEGLTCDTQGELKTMFVMPLHRSSFVKPSWHRLFIENNLTGTLPSSFGTALGTLEVLLVGPDVTSKLATDLTTDSSISGNVRQARHHLRAHVAGTLPNSLASMTSLKILALFSMSTYLYNSSISGAVYCSHSKRIC